MPDARRKKCKAQRRTEKVTYGVRELDQFLSLRGASRCCAHMQRGLYTLADILMRANNAEKVSILRTWAEKESLLGGPRERGVMRIREIRLLTAA